MRKTDFTQVIPAKGGIFSPADSTLVPAGRQAGGNGGGIPATASGPIRSLSGIYRPIRSELKAAEALFLKEGVSTNGLMGELTRYIARMPGKRIRPALALLSASLAAKKEDRCPPSRRERTGRLLSPAVRLATAVEMIHTATLLHDDVIDGASLRRGLSTLNSKWGDTLSVLSGDYLYSKAFCLLSGLKRPDVLRLMSDTARTVCEGEVAQIHHQYDWTLTVPRYLKIIRWKTASLMAASTQAGGLLGGSSEAQAEGLRRFGLNFGIAFQILDDTQDLLGMEEDSGKSLGTDLALGHLTLPLLYLRDSARPEVRDPLVRWFHGNGNGSRTRTPTLPLTEPEIRLLKEEALNHQVPVYCRRIAMRYLAKAEEALRPFPVSVYKESLLALVDHLLR
jgi:octaprenyl-diphosphate synthase